MQKQHRACVPPVPIESFEAQSRGSAPWPPRMSPAFQTLDAPGVTWSRVTLAYHPGRPPWVGGLLSKFPEGNMCVLKGMERTLGKFSLWLGDR